MKLSTACAVMLVAVALASASTPSGLHGPQSPRRLAEAGWMPQRPHDQSCLKALPGGCYLIRDKGTCLGSKDGRQKVEWQGLQIADEPCVWCGGGTCHNNNTNVCEPYDFLYRGQGVGFKQFMTTTNYEVAHCDDGVALAPRTATAPPQSAEEAAAALCSVHPGCAALGLSSTCCPDPAGTMLDCCNQAASDNTAVDTDSASRSVPAPLSPFMNDSWWKTAQETVTDTACLMEHTFGCNVIQNQLTCLGSKDARDEDTIDGLKIKGQPCVWCGGGPCHSKSTSLCEPLDYLMNGEGKAFTTFFAKPTYQVAKCNGSQPVAPEKLFRQPPLPTIPTLAPWWIPEPPVPDVMSCLEPLPGGCFNATTMGQCMHSKDSSNVAELSGLKVAGEACVWCGGMPCTSNSSAVCAPFDYALRGEGTAFSLFYAKTHFKVAGCPKSGITLPRSVDFKCLSKAESGCHTMQDAAGCLSHVDGRRGTKKDGFNVSGQPCVWCGGGPCTSASLNGCEPFDWVMNGDGQAFVSSSSKDNFRIAGCKNGRPASVSLSAYTDVTSGYVFDPSKGAPLVPFWVAQKPAKEDMTCLKSVEGGCNILRDMADCMTSQDGRPIKEFDGLKINGEACVWCGGIPCTTNSTSLCEPFDYVMYGEGKLFSSFAAKGVYKVADCKKGDIELPNYNYDCLESSSSGGCNALWNAEECLAGKDGRSVPTVGVLEVQNQPCVWCGGGPCHSGKTALCEAFDYAVNGEGRAFAQFHAQGVYRLAACQNGQPKAATLTNFTDFVPGYTFKPLPVPTIPPREKWWLQNRSGANVTCLTPQASGCAALKEMGACLSSKDGRPMATTDDGLKINGEPCVWCGGGQCHSNGTTLCEPFDYLMNGEGKAFPLFLTPHNFRVAGCQAGGVPLPNFSFTCLSAANSGCNSVKDAGTCLQSKDGRPDVTIAGLKVHDQPCVWCGGTPCHTSSGALCEPFDYAMNGEGKAFDLFNAKLSYSFAGCKDDRAAAMTYDGFVDYVQGYIPALNTPRKIVPFWVPEKPKVEDLTCLTEYPGGCSAIGEMKTCMSSRDGGSTQTYEGLKMQGEPCVWCGGTACTTNSSAKCLPFDYAMHGEGVAFTSFLSKPNFRVAGCYTPYDLPAYDYTCLKAAAKGCSAITNPYDCLGSDDGRPNSTIDGLKVAGQPCVWCGGGLCHTGASTMCEPFDYVMNGAGRAFYNFNAKLTYRMAACQDGQPHGATLEGPSSFIPGALPTIKPYWWVTEPKPQGEELSCLMEHKFGCYVIKSKETCLGSKDGRQQKDFMGLKVQGEPCVWCGGLPCQTNSTNLCEPYDFLLYGEGKAFLNFNAKTTYNVARCKDGKPTDPDAPEAVADNGTLAVSGATAAAAAGAIAAAAGTQEAQAAGKEGAMAGKDCFSECGAKSGTCAWCGTGKACCRDGWTSDVPECQGATGFTTSATHECVTVSAAATPLSASVAGGTETTEVTETSKDTVVVSAPELPVAVPVAVPEVPPAAPAAPTVAPVATPTLAPVVLPTAAPLATPAPGTAAPEAASTAAPAAVTLAPVATVAPAAVTLAPVATAAPVLPEGATLPPLPALPPLPTIAPAETSGNSSQPANVAEDDCWWKCGEKSGDCPSACGEGKACCRSGAVGEAPECGGLSLGSFSTILHHVCVEKAAETATGALGGGMVFGIRMPGSAGASNKDIRVPGLPGTPAPEGGVLPAPAPAGELPGEGPAGEVPAPEGGVLPAPAGEVPAEAGETSGTVEFRNATNGTNATVVAGDESSGGVPTWVWIAGAAGVIVGGPVLAYAFTRGGKEKRRSKSKKPKRSRSMEVDEDSFATNVSELEMQTPLVASQDRSINVGQGGGGDLFDMMDQNHDGVISQSEFNRAMGFPQAQAAAPMAAPMAMPVATQVAAPVMRQFVPQQPFGAAPVMEPTTVMQGAMSIGAAPVAAMQPGMPGRIIVTPYGSNIQYGQPGVRPYGA